MKDTIEKKEIEVVHERIEREQIDFNKVMNDVKPFVKKSKLYFESTDGKWHDASSISDSIISMPPSPRFI